MMTFILTGGFRGRGRGRGNNRGGGGFRGGRGHGPPGPPVKPPPLPIEVFLAENQPWNLSPDPIFQLPPKPWVDFALNSQIYLRDSLKVAAKKSKKGEDFEKYREQRAKVSRMETDAMNVFFRINPSQEAFWLPLLAVEANQGGHFCDMCELGFESENDLIRHEEEHQVCGLEGCTFSASAKVSKRTS